MQSSKYRLGYRSDIEGLRAVAILLVVAAHAKVMWLAGGFVGVDVFFVLSGYLITGLLVQEIETTRNFRFTAFYARRFRRLLPGLLLMLGCTCVLGRLLISPGEQAGQATAAASAAVWLSNFFFAFSNMDYFSPGTETNLFLHTWSLGVEEQFYLVWPLLLVLTLGAWAGAKRLLEPSRSKIAMLVVFFISLSACMLWTGSSPRLAFYMMPARAWQFALGALVFLYFGSPATATNGHPLHDRHDKPQRLVTLVRCGGWLGLALIFTSAFVFDGNVPYPGAWALFPSIGAAAVLAAGARSPYADVGRILSWRPMQAIGRVSYTWYLWHWPVLLLGATLVNLESATNRLGLVVLSFVLAVVSYHFVETPIRRNPRLVVQPRIAVLSAVVLMIVANALAIRWHNAATARMAQPDQVRYLQSRLDAPIIYGMDCDDWYRSSDVHICAFGSPDAKHTAIVMGDSVGLQWFPAVSEVFDRPDWRLFVLTKSSCPMVDEPMFYPRIGREFTECAKWRQAALQQVVALKPEVMIFGSTYTYDFTQNQWTEGTTRVLQSISSATGHIYILRSTPILPFDGPSCLAPRSWLYKAVSQKSDCVANPHDTHSENVYTWLKTSASGFQNVSVVDMTDAICPNGQCRAEQHGVIVFRDSQHLTATFVKSLSDALGMQLDLTTIHGVKN